MRRKPFAIAIDGPGSSGKGTVARKVAQLLNFSYVDTGAMYRAVALVATRRGVSWEDGPALGAMVDSMDFAFEYKDGRFTVFVDGEDLGDSIRSEECSRGASRVATWPEVRAALLETQRRLARSRGVVMDGRDIGTVVLPDATLKIYLDARPEERARRRTAELQARGLPVTFEGVLSELQDRDAQDMGRAAAPLKAADDAVILDSTAVDADGAAARVVELARERGA